MAQLPGRGSASTQIGDLSPATNEQSEVCATGSSRIPTRLRALGTPNASSAQVTLIGFLSDLLGAQESVPAKVT